jgi:hypothetical protein
MLMYNEQFSLTYGMPLAFTDYETRLKIIAEIPITFGR